MNPKTGLYGICRSNRSADSHWGKNCFNSSFPTAMANYMMDMDIPAIYITLSRSGGNLVTKPKKLSVRDLFRCGEDEKPEQLCFNFETVYEPYQSYAFDRIDAIDLVVADSEGKSLAPLEVKLTVLPTSGTSNLPESQWGSELVIRSATTSYCAFGMFDAVKGKRRQVREIFEDSCASIQSWDHDFEMAHKTSSLCSALDTFEECFVKKQKPLVMQTLWKTEGQSPILADRAFGLVVWSDFAFSRLFIDKAGKESPQSMSRHMRAAARLARCLWELSKSDRIHIAEIYRQMAFGNQTDKEFSINGQIWRKYVNCKHIDLPLRKDAVREIIAPGYIERLRPERRFDQTLYFTMRS